jgi:hypothetical protein
MKAAMKNVFIIVLVLGGFIQLYAQTDFIAAQDGVWTDPETWGLEPCSPCTAGVDYPGQFDDVYTNRFSISGISGQFCRNLLIASDHVGGIVGPGLLTITGTLGGWDVDNFLPKAPTEEVFSGVVTLSFTAANWDGTPFQLLGNNEVIAFWSSNALIPNALFPLVTDATIDAGDIFFGETDNELKFGTFSLAAGTGQLSTSFNITAIRANSVTVGANRILNITVPISGQIGQLESSRTSSSVSISGTLITSSFINSTNFSLGAAGTLVTSFSGAGQSEGGWWHDDSIVPNNAGTAFGINTTLNYAASSSQQVYVKTYGSLELSGSGTKTLVGPGTTLNILGSLEINDAGVTFNSSAASAINIGRNLICEGSWTPSVNVTFNNSTPAVSGSITGLGTLTFNNGIQVNKTGQSLTFGKNLTLNNSVTVLAGTLNLGNVTTTFNGASVVNDGIITSGGGGFLSVSGSSTFSGSGSTTLNNLTISSGSTNFNKSVTLTGNLVNNGSLSFSATVTVTFTGGTSQSISGNAMTIGHMAINKPSSTLTNNTTVRLTGVLTLTTGTFDADGSGGGNFILNSDTNGDAAIGPMGGGSIIGEVTFERYFNNTQNRWRNLAFPVTSVTYAELGASIELQTNSLAVYTESVLGNVDQGWSYVTGGTLNSRRGHTAWMYNLEPITISVRGPLLQNVPASDPYDFAVTYTDDPEQPASEDGWNFVPNPFASPIRWDNPGWVKTNVNSQIAVWDTGAGVYRYTGAGWDGVIAQGQAFWIQTNAPSPALTCIESVKEAVSDPAFFRTKASEIPSRLVISLNSDLHTDIAVVHFNEKALAEFDSEFDAYKLKNLIFNLSTLTNEGANLAVNVLPKSSCTSSIRLNITNIDPGTYALSFEGLGSFDNLRSMVLTDNFTGKSEKISESTVYSFEVTSDGKSFGAERFSLGFDFSDAKAQPVVTKEGSKLTSDYDEGNQWLVNGKVIPGATGKSIIPGQPGLYQVQVNDGSCLLVSESLSVKESVSRIYPNPATDEIKVDLFGLLEDSYETEGDIYLYSMNGELIRKEVFSKGDDIKAVKLDGVKPGVYMINLVTNKSNVIFRERIVIR